MEYPLISVVIPCHNSSRHISHAIDAMLCQTYQNLEIIIVDDNSTDGLDNVVDPYLRKYNQIKCFKLPSDDPIRYNRNGDNINAGWSARNYGVSKCSGTLITFQDADDGSCSNRIEFQYQLMKENNSHHVNVDWQQYEDKLNCKKLLFDLKNEVMVGTDEILKLADNSRKGIFKRPFGKYEDFNPLSKFIRKVDRRFLRDWISYPGAASMPLVKREVFDKCCFRQLSERTRPSLRGRGADCDFNFWVAETFKDSVVALVPLVLWRVKNQNSKYLDYKYRPS